MTPPMTPREKVIAILDEHTTVGGTSAYRTGQVNSDELTGLIITALASGSGDHADHSGGVTDMVDHAELARLAKEASSGPWSVDADDIGRTIVASPVEIVARDTRHNSAFIAAANPATVLALLAENAALRGDLAKTERDFSELRDSYDRVSNKLCVERAHGSRETKRATEAERKLAEAVEVGLSIYIYANDTLSGRIDGPDDRAWQRAAVVEIRNRARVFRSKEAERG